MRAARGERRQIARLPNRNEPTASTRKMKKQILASDAASPAIPPNPRTAAMIATMKNPIAQLSMVRLLVSVGYEPTLRTTGLRAVIQQSTCHEPVCPLHMAPPRSRVAAGLWAASADALARPSGTSCGEGDPVERCA